MSLVLPGLFALIWYGLHFQRFSNYEGRLFTLGERLLSQPRALMDYIGALLLPRGLSLGVYTDDFAISHGLLDPPSTLLAIFALICLIAFAVWARLRSPAIFTGIGLYLAGHTMESTVLPLELYFEHRNYLPSLGLFLAVVGVIDWLLPRLMKQSDDAPRLRKLLGGSAIIVLLLLAAATFARAGVWSSWPLLAAQGVQQHPQSMRAHLDYADILRLQGRYAEAQAVFDYMTTMDNPAARHAGIIDTVALQCMTQAAASPAAVARIATIKGSKLQLAEMSALENLGNYLQQHDCEHLEKSQLATLIVKIVDAAPQPPHLTAIWRNRFGAAQLYASSGLLPQAQQQAALAWMSGGADPSVGIFLASLYFHINDMRSARLILADTRKHVQPWDQRNLKLIGQLEHQLESSANDSGVAPSIDNPAH